MGIGTKWYRTTILTIAGIPFVEKLSTTYGKKLADRFIAGENLTGALKQIEALNKHGICASLDHLGEGVTKLSEASDYKEQYLKMIEGITDCKLNANVSLKPTQMGLALNAEACYANIQDVVQQAMRYNNFVRIDMENTPYTQATLDMVRRLHREGLTSVGTVLQAYLHRTAKDAAELMDEGINLRLVKGAYKEPQHTAYQKTSDVISNFKAIIKLHLDNGVYTAIASHDDLIINWVKQYTALHGIPKDAFEFQMLYGLRMNAQAQLAKDGYRIRCYVPYGSMWYPYFTRRLAEKPANLMLVIKNIFK